MPIRRRLRPSSSFLRALALGALGLVTSSFVACDNLPDIPDGVCGNGVIDRDEGEECDTIVDPAYESDAATLEVLCKAYRAGFKLDESTKCRYSCADAEASHACQYVWGAPIDTASSDPADQAIRVCPPGFGVGADGQCRRGSNRFEASAKPIIDASGFDGQSADLDGDGYRDLVVTSTGGAGGPSITYLDSSGIVAGPSTTGVRPIVGELTEDDLSADDVVLPIGAALVTLRGEPGPSYSPKVYTPFPLEGELPIPLPPGVTIGDRRLMSTKSETNFDVPYVVVEAQGVPLVDKSLGFIEISLENYGPTLDLPFTIAGLNFSDLRGGPIAVDIAVRDPAAEPTMVMPGDGGEILVATKDSIIVTSRAIDPPNADPTGTFDMDSTPEIYKLSDLAPNIGVNDGIVSLIEVANWHVPAVAAVMMSGKLVLLEQYTEVTPMPPPDPPPPPPPFATYALPSAVMGMDEPVDPAGVKAIGDIDGDGDLDLVTERSVLFIDYDTGTPITPTKVTEAAKSNANSWSQARIADLNGNGRMSVIATPPSSGVDIFLPGTSFAMSSASLATSARVDQLAIGDFDGDGAEDILVGTDIDGAAPMGGDVKESCDQYDDIEVAYGRPAGPPEDFALLGNLPGLRRIITGRLAVKGQEDAVSDVGLETACDPSTLMAGRRAGLLFGSTDRAVYSPYLPFNGPDDRDAIVVTGVVGQFSRPEDDVDGVVHNDLMVVTVRPDCDVMAGCTFMDRKSIGYEIAPVFGTGDAELSAPSLGTTNTAISLLIDDLGDEQPQNVTSRAPAILAAELDGDPATEEAIVLTTPVGDTTLDGHIVVAQMDGDAPKLLSEQRFTTNIKVLGSTTKLRLIDYDEDGELDVVAIVGFSGPGGAGAQAFLARNTGGGMLATPVEIDASQFYSCATSVVDTSPIPVAPCPKDAGADACATAAKNLLVATDRSLSLCSTSPGASGIVADSCSPFLDVPSRSDAIIGTVMDDFDGDGLVDLAVMRRFETEIHRQCALSEVLSGSCNASKSSPLAGCAE